MPNNRRKRGGGGGTGHPQPLTPVGCAASGSPCVEAGSGVAGVAASPRRSVSTPEERKRERNLKKKENRKEKKKEKAKLQLDIDVDALLYTLFDETTGQPKEVKLMKHFEESAERLHPMIGCETIRVPSVHINSGQESEEFVSVYVPQQNDDSKLRSDRAESLMANCMFHLSESVYLHSVVGPFFIITSYEYQHYLARLKAHFKEHPDMEREISMTGLANMPTDDQSAAPCGASASSPSDQPASTSQPQSTGGKQRGEIDMIILSKKHVVFLEVKAIGDNLEKHQSPESSVLKKLRELVKQLRDDRRVFQHIMRSVLEGTTGVGGVKPGDTLRQSLVAALPNLTTQLVARCFEMNQDLLQEFKSLDIKILTKDFMPKTRINIADDFREFSTWWRDNVFSYAFQDDGTVLSQGMEHLAVVDNGGAAESLTEKPVSPGRLKREEKAALSMLKSMVGRYVGLLSVVHVSKNSKFSLQRVEAHSEGQLVWYIGKRFSDIVLTQTQMEYVNQPCRYGYLQGPPGSGKTVVLALRARWWIHNHKNFVVIVNMYRGCRRGRIIGRQMYHTVTQVIREEDTELLETHCLVYSVDVDTFSGKDFAKLKETIYGKFGSDLGENGNRLLFVIDETYVKDYWNSVYAPLRENFPEASMWCAGLFGKKPEECFTAFALQWVVRCPPKIQRVLRLIDWEPSRRACYAGESTDDSLPTPLPADGTNVLTVRHLTQHGEYSLLHPAQCPQCGDELAAILEKFNVEKPATPHTESHLKQWTLKCSDIVFLVGMPRSAYKLVGTRDGKQQYLDTTISKYQEHMRSFEGCAIIKALEARGYPVRVHKDLSCPGMLEGRISTSSARSQSSDQSSEVINLTWVYTYQGMENKVIIFLPGDHAIPSGDNIDRLWTDPSINIPLPGLLKDVCDDSGVIDKLSGDPGAVGCSGGSHLADSATWCGSLRCSDLGPGEDGYDDDEDKDENDNKGRQLPHELMKRSSVSGRHFKDDDIECFGRWDKNNMLIAASRSTSLLVIVQCGVAAVDNTC